MAQMDLEELKEQEEKTANEEQMALMDLEDPMVKLDTQVVEDHVDPLEILVHLENLESRVLAEPKDQKEVQDEPEHKV